MTIPPVLTFGAHPADVRGLGAGVEYATALYPAEPFVFTSRSGRGRGARGFGHACG